MAQEELPTGGTWLLKPVKSAGGIGIKPWFAGPGQARLSRSKYLQQYVEGVPCSAVYLGQGRNSQLLGVTGQLVGLPWLNAFKFQYCGSYGPLPLNEGTRTAFERIGAALARGCGFRGLFGVDAVIRAGVPWPVEVNPRYTASVEVLEHVLGTAALAMHRACFEPRAVVPVARGGKTCVGKAVLYARAPLRFPNEGPWLQSLGANVPGWQMPDYADIPDGGERIEDGQPILTILASGSTPEDVLESLRRRVSDLDRRLFGR
jgi:predicted ATP-grasp superfamily ATP-dependent carboligase